MKRAWSCLLLLLLLSFSSGSCDKGGETPAGDAFSPEIRRELEGILDAAMTEDGIPGAVVGVWVPGRGAWVEAKGLADTSRMRAMQPVDRFRIGGLTMTFTATVVLQLVDEGRLKLDDPLSLYFPGTPQVAEITVRQLLNHSSGLFEYFEDSGFLGIEQQDPLRRWSPEELVGIAFSHPPYFPPGQAFHYSNTNYIILGLLVEKVTASRLEEEVDRRITSRLGLLNTYFPRGSSLPGQYSHGYLKGEGEDLVDVSNTFDPSWAWAAGAMTSNLEDLKVYARVLGEGTLIGQTMQRERLKTVKAQAGGEEYQYGLGIASRGGFLGHNGYYPGYSCAAYYDPAYEATIVILINRTEEGRPNAALEIFKDMVEVLYPSS